MGEKKGESPEEGGDLPQYNYRVPGEPETIGSESKETVGGDPEEVADEVAEDQERADKRRDASEESGEVSPDHGQSPPQTQAEVDGENTWSGKGGRGRDS